MRLLTLFILLLALNACSSMPSSSTASYPATELNPQLTEVYLKYQGSPYQYGGMTAQGFDCSGFIKVAYNEAFQKNIPRTTEQLFKHGYAVRRDQLATGDVVFFKTSYKQLHAGIYMGDNTFIHASTSKGVIRSSLKTLTGNDAT
jgi:cell wall-associated NlpC family hydrolase